LPTTQRSGTHRHSVLEDNRRGLDTGSQGVYPPADNPVRDRWAGPSPADVRYTRAGDRFGRRPL